MSLINDLIELIKTNQLTSPKLDAGKYVQKLERQFRDYTGANHAIAVDHGTSAIYASLFVLGFKSDKIAFPSFTFRGTRSAILGSSNFAIPIDVSLDNMTIQTEIPANFDAIVPVHLYGHVAELEKLMEMERPVVEDCAQSLGSKWKNKSVGRFGKVGCFSFYPSKIINGAEGGMIITDDKNIADQLKLFRNHGDEKSWGLNLRMSELHALLASHNMETIDDKLAERKKTAQAWHEHFSKNHDDVIISEPRQGETRNNQLFTIRSTTRDKIKQKHKESKIYYPYTLGEGENAKELSETVLSFPTA